MAHRLPRAAVRAFASLTRGGMAAVDLRAVRADPAAVAANCAARGVRDVDAFQVARLYEEHGRANEELTALRAERNANAALLKAKRGGKGGDPPLTDDARAAIVADGAALKERIRDAEAEELRIRVALDAEAVKLPNETHPDVPRGDEDASRTVRVVGERVSASDAPLDHVALNERLAWFDLAAGATTTGSKFVYMTGDGALLELALIQWAMSEAGKRGFRPVLPPDLVHADLVGACGFRPRADEHSQIYATNDDLVLAATAELPLAGLHANRVIRADAPPVRTAAFSHCFRHEVGGAGAGSRGIFRLHQFSKVESFIVCAPDASDRLHEDLVAMQCELYDSLGLHFRVRDMATEDLGAPAYRKYDVEAWMPGRGDYAEICSASNCTTYQARRLGMRAVVGEKRRVYAHTLNATVCAVPRVMIALMETHQQPDGSVRVPPPLRPFLGGRDVLEPHDDL